MRRQRFGLNALAAVCGLVAALAVLGGVARAEAPGLVADGQFEAPGALGVAVDNSCSMHTPPLSGEACTAFDASAGDVYVAGFLYEQEGNLTFGHVSKFDASGSLLTPPSPIGEGVALSYGGAAVDPVNGDVYAMDALEHKIDIFDPASGELVGAFPVESAGNFNFLLLWTFVEIAADSAGNVYVPVARKEISAGSGSEVPGAEVLEYSPTGELLKTFTGGSGAGALRGPTGVTVDPAGNLWVADTGNNRIEELSPSDTVVRDIRSEGVASVALDAKGNLFAIVNNAADSCGEVSPPCPHLVEYDSAGVQVADLGASTIGAGQFNLETGTREALPDMVAASDATGEVYVTEAILVHAAGGSAGRVWKFRPPVAPSVESETAVEVGASGARLGAKVNPGGLGGSYRFEYGTSTAYGSSVPSPEGDTGAGFASRTVWAGISGLQPGTTYHYRVVVTGALGEQVVGGDQTVTTETAAQAACPNELVRTSFSAKLPDCRAYELVTPPNKDSAQPDRNEGGNGLGELSISQTLRENLAAVDGSRLSFTTEDVLPGSPSVGESYVATRGSDGWTSENMFPSTNYYGFECPGALKVQDLGGAYSADLSKAIIKVGAAGLPCGVEPELVSGEPRGENENLFVRDNNTGKYQLINITPEAVVPATPQLLGESADFSRIVFSEEAELTENAPAGVNDVYEWSAGHVQLATVLPDRTAAAGSFVDISTDGSHVFFAAAGNLYARVDGSETVQLDASQAAGPGGGGAFLKASHDGSVVLFTDADTARLTADTAAGSGTNLYRYDSNAPAGQRLTDLTPVANAVAPALAGISKDGSIVYFTDADTAHLTADTVAGSGTNLYRYEASAPAGLGLTDMTPAAHVEVQNVLGVSEDGSSVYFDADGVLSSQANQHGELPHSGQPNIYLSHGAGSAFIAGSGFGHYRVSANGAFLLFESGRSLTGYNNFDPSTEGYATELYLYDAAQNSLMCASCNPSGAPPTPPFAGGPDMEGGAIAEGVNIRSSRQLTENGQVFFDSAEGLLPSDTNGSQDCSTASKWPACTDVYEFEPDGAGTCVQAAGCLYLISTGTGSLETFFVDASPSGNDVFIREFQKLVPRDTQEGAPSLYDVRVDGGFAETAPPPPCATADACRTAPAAQPAIFGAPASQTFAGAGNVRPPATAASKEKKHEKKKKKAHSTRCRRNRSKASRCVARKTRARVKAKSHKGGK